MTPPLTTEQVDYLDNNAQRGNLSPLTVRQICTEWRDQRETIARLERELAALVGGISTSNKTQKFEWPKPEWDYD